MEKLVLVNILLAGITILSSTAIAGSLIDPTYTHHFERFTAAHLSSLNCQTPDDMGFETADHYRNWPQLLNTIPSDLGWILLERKVAMARWSSQNQPSIVGRTK